jgi:hypothetical protein
MTTRHSFKQNRGEIPDVDDGPDRGIRSRNVGHPRLRSPVKGRLVPKTRISMFFLSVSALIASVLPVSCIFAQEEEAKVPIIGDLFEIVANDSSRLEPTTHTATTKDGWDLSLRRYPVKGESSPRS